MVSSHWHRWENKQGRATGVLEIVTGGRRVWSIPSLWGCPVRCSFCISSSQAYGGPLQSQELLDLVEHVRTNSVGNLPVELSFTGEGEAVLNVEAVQAFFAHASAWPEVQSARICVSGLNMGKSEAFANLPWPTRLQCSLHSAVQATRDVLVPKSIDLVQLRQELLRLTPLFASVDVNVVLQDGVNDCDAHQLALQRFVQGTPWRVVFNPLMREGSLAAHPNRNTWVNALRQQGTDALAYTNVGADLVDQKLYSKLTFVRNPAP